jgi:starvation-inducible DNA-binding protein
MQHLGALDVVYSRIVSGHRDAIEAVAKIDPISEDLLISQTRALEKHHWFIRAHLEDIEGRLSTDDASSEEDAAAAAVTAPKPGEETIEEEEGVKRARRSA